MAMPVRFEASGRSPLGRLFRKIEYVNIVLREWNVATARFQFLFEPARQVPTKSPIVFLLAPGPDDEVDRGVSQLCHRYFVRRIVERSWIRRDHPFDDRDSGSNIVAVGDTHDQVDPTSIVEGIVLDDLTIDLSVRDGDPHVVWRIQQSAENRNLGDGSGLPRDLDEIINTDRPKDQKHHSR